MASVSQWEREVIGERTKDALRHKKGNGERVGTVPFGFHLAADGVHLEKIRKSKKSWRGSWSFAERVTPYAQLQMN